jgi:hypothetical protein
MPHAQIRFSNSFTFFQLTCPSNGRLGSRLEVGTIFIELIYNVKKEDKNNV